jgi:hypothetical protein
LRYPTCLGVTWLLSQPLLLIAVAVQAELALTRLIRDLCVEFHASLPPDGSRFAYVAAPLRTHSTGLQ